MVPRNSRRVVTTAVLKYLRNSQQITFTSRWAKTGISHQNEALHRQFLYPNRYCVGHFRYPITKSSFTSMGWPLPCVCSQDKPLFLPVGIQYNQCACRFFNPRDMQALWSPNYATEILHSYAASRV